MMDYRNSFNRNETEDKKENSTPEENSFSKKASFSKNRKTANLAKKVGTIALSAVLFGSVAGGTFQAVNYFAGSRTAASTTTTQTTSNSSLLKAAATSSGSASTGTLDVSTIAKNAMPSIVSITNKSVQEVQNYFSMFGYGAQTPQTEETTSCGSGIIIGKNDTELLIVTNNHVVDGADTLSVSFVNNQVCEANIKGTDSDNDLAVIAVPLSEIPDDTMNSIAIATMGDSDSVHVGEQVVAIGNALGYGQSVTTGIISAANRVIDGNSSSDGGTDGTASDSASNDTTGKTYLQTDAAINPGNSGGALLNMNGEVIGINSAKLASTEVEGMGYAIPVSRVSDIIENLMNEQTRTKVSSENQGTLGIKCLDVSSQIQQAYSMPAGIYISEVTSGGAAEKAGLKSGYVLTSFDGHSVTSTNELKSLLSYYSAGETVEVEAQVPDNGSYETKTFSLTLGTNTASAENSQSDSQQNANPSRSEDAGNTMASTTPGI
ncbi:S1C family serine protease [Fusicatenibacter sp.]